MQRTILTLFLALVLAATPGRAQRLVSPLVPQPDTPAATPIGLGNPQASPRPARSPVVLALGGVLAGTAGTFGGAWIGSRFRQDACEDCGLQGLVYGGMAGGSALLPLGVHLANGGRGNYGASLAASLGIGAAGLAVAMATNEGAVLLPVPVLQLVSSILIERNTAR
jgi:hypothetical protein